MEFKTERDLVETFLQVIDTDVWQPYAETGGFDLLLSRKFDGFQIGIEAKLTLNTKVITQAANLAVSPRQINSEGPDCRAVLVPWQRSRREQGDYQALLHALQIVVLRIGGRTARPWLSQSLPVAPETGSGWPEHFPASRITLPDYIPDVAAGVASPIRLTAWKIKAIKIVVLLRHRGYLVREDFRRLQVSPSTWTQRGWIVPGPIRGRWIEGSGIPDFKAQHPVNFDQIAANMGKWNSRDLEGVI